MGLREEGVDESFSLMSLGELLMPANNDVMYLPLKQGTLFYCVF